MSWRAKANCKGANVAIFFSKRTSADGECALALCDSCTVRDECLQDAMRTETIRVGIRGGLTSYERDILHRHES